MGTNGDLAAAPILRKLSQVPDAAATLVCFPYAGGGPRVFRQWPRMLPGFVQVYAAQLAGREGRAAEQPLTDLRSQVTELVAAVRPLGDRPLVLFGHSLGATLAAHVAQEVFPVLSRPSALVVAARHSPWGPAPVARESTMDDEELVEAFHRGGGIDKLVLENPELRRAAVGPLRADVRMAESAQWLTEAALSSPLYALWGTRDPAIGESEMRHWARFSSGVFRAFPMPGGHLFATTDPRPVIGILASLLESLVRAASWPQS
jgi:pyochelin biosynthetic protein PchC